ncbi:MAG: hypothetical protein ACO1SV_10315 [Fimbriimonas sp.]
MSWSDVPSIVFGVVVALILGLCLYLIGVMAASSLWPRRFGIVSDVETPLGRFRRIGEGWIANAVGDDFVQVIARDRDGTPDPGFLEAVPDLLQALRHYELLARDFEPLLESLNYDLSAIRQGEGDHEWSLLFDEYDEELAERAVDFANGRPIRASIA